MKDSYIYKDTGVLINKLGIKNYEELREANMRNIINSDKTQEDESR